MKIYDKTKPSERPTSVRTLQLHLQGDLRDYQFQNHRLYIDKYYWVGRERGGVGLNNQLGPRNGSRYGRMIHTKKLSQILH